MRTFSMSFRSSPNRLEAVVPVATFSLRTPKAWSSSTVSTMAPVCRSRTSNIRLNKVGKGMVPAAGVKGQAGGEGAAHLRPKKLIGS